MATDLLTTKRRGIAPSSSDFKQFHGHGDGLAATNAQRGDAESGSLKPHGMDEGYQCAGAAGTYRVAEGDGSSVDVEFVMRNRKLFHGRHCDDCKRLVDFK